MLKLEKRILDLGEHRVEYCLCGDSGPVIVLINGFRIRLESWEKLYPEIGQYGRVLTYNRLGIGKSTKANTDQTGDVVINIMREMLSALNLQPPFVLVAHSLGGVFANLYARLKPEEVSAVVFVDAAHPDEASRQSGYKPPWLLRTINDGVKAIERIFYKYVYSEDECLQETIRQIKAAGDFPPIPLTVVTGTKKMPFIPEGSFNIHLQCQKELLQLSPLSQQYFAEQSGHFPQITQPRLVLAAIRQTVKKHCLD
ncbi:alpha/beta fold hydrolase [Kaarinaea lacus]